MKEYNVCFTYESEVITETILGKHDSKSEDILQEIFKRIVSRTNTGYNKVDNYMASPSALRYIRVLGEKNAR
jgi:hypothetical protein